MLYFQWCIEKAIHNIYQTKLCFYTFTSLKVSLVIWNEIATNIYIQYYKCKKLLFNKNICLFFWRMLYLCVSLSNRDVQMMKKVSHLALVPRSLAGLLEISDEVAGHLANLPGIRSEDHSLDDPAVTVKSAEGRVGVQLYHPGHGGIGDQHTRIDHLGPESRQEKDQQNDHLQTIRNDWSSHSEWVAVNDWRDLDGRTTLDAQKLQGRAHPSTQRRNKNEKIVQPSLSGVSINITESSESEERLSKDR